MSLGMCKLERTAAAALSLAAGMLSFGLPAVADIRCAIDTENDINVWDIRSALNSKIRFNTAHFSKKNRHFMQYTFCIPYAAFGITEKDMTDGFAMNVTANDDDGEGRESMMTLAGEHDGAPSRWPMVKFEKGDVVP